MSAATKIEWCDRTASPWYGCQKVSPACDHCYAESWGKRSGMVDWGPHAERLRSKSYRATMLKWQREAAKKGITISVFASLCDPLDNAVPIEWFVDYLDVLRTTPNLRHLLLTKRIGNWRKRLADAEIHARLTNQLEVAGWIKRWTTGTAPANVWAGATVVNQAEADRDLLKLLHVPVRVRFLSIEPMLGPMNIGLLGVLPGKEFIGYQLVADRLHWIICGGESGHKARPMLNEWAQSLVDQCKAAGVAAFVKQLSSGSAKPIKDIAEFPFGLRVREFPHALS